MNVLPLHIPHNEITKFDDGSIKIGLKGRLGHEMSTISVGHTSYPSRGKRVSIGSLLLRNRGLIAGYDPIADDGYPTWVADFKEGDVFEVVRPTIYWVHERKWSTEALGDAYIKPAISGLFRVRKRKAWVDGQGYNALVVYLDPIEQ